MKKWIQVLLAASAAAVLGSGAVSAQVDASINCGEKPRGPALWDRAAGYDLAVSAIENARTAADFQTVSGLVEGALATCTALRDARTGQRRRWGVNNVLLQQCVGDANELLAARSTSWLGQNPQAHRAAYCAYAAADGLLANSRDANSTTWRAAALEGQGSALRGMGRVIEAQRAYAAAIGLQPNHRRYLALADLQASAGSAQAASTSLDSLLGLPASPAFQQTERLKALHQKAELQQAHAQLFGVDSVRKAWSDLRSEPPTTDADFRAKANFHYGKTWFEAGEDGLAREAFTAAAQQGTGEEARAFADRAQYYLALIEARTARTAAQWAEVARLMATVRGVDAEYQTLNCIAAIGQRLAPILVDQNVPSIDSTPCRPLGTPGSDLLAGMYQLRQAQHLSTACAVRDCREQYDQRRFDDRVLSVKRAALASFQRATASPDAIFNWTAMPNATQPKLAHLLSFGVSLANLRLQLGSCSQGAPPGDPASVEFFERLNVVGCLATN